ncbi:MAG: glutathione-disulfide reductase, partial [Gammaproteobacteria bacterium]|nr:glutathione-disulfide reductase [Gammaproteobacteria bacterium]
GDGQGEMDYDLIPTAVFCEPNIATVGLNETQALAQGLSLRIYESRFRPLKHTLTGRETRCYMKLVVDDVSDRVLGIHMAGPDVAEILQGFAVALRAGATKAVFDATLGIHPSAAEELVTLRQPSRFVSPH